ncbi:hypothetical protein ACX80U_12085 [Arthrobacter sp. TmT3-37]
MTDLAQVTDLEKAWRTLASFEKPRAEYYLGFASRRIRQRWADVDQRLALAVGDPRRLDPDDVRDVAVHLVLGVIDGPTMRGVKSFSESSGSMARSVTLEAGKQHLIAFEDWMVQIFEPSASPAAPRGPRGHFPKSRGYGGLFPGREEY